MNTLSLAGFHFVFTAINHSHPRLNLFRSGLALHSDLIYSEATCQTDRVQSEAVETHETCSFLSVRFVPKKPCSCFTCQTEVPSSPPDS